MSRDVARRRGMSWRDVGVVLWCGICGFSEVVDLVRSRDVARCRGMSRDVAGCRGAMLLCCVVLWWCGICGFSDVVDLAMLRMSRMSRCCCGVVVWDLWI